MKICAHCDMPILRGEEHDRITPDGGSVGKPDILRHRDRPGRRRRTRG